MPERDGKDQGEDNPYASGLVLVRLSQLTSYKWRELVSSGGLVCRCHVVFLLCYVRFVLFRFRLFALTEAAALRSIVHRYACAPTATRSYLTTVCVLFCFSFFLWRCRFFRVCLHHLRFLFVWRVRRTFFTSGWCFFYLLTTGWTFDISFMCMDVVRGPFTRNTTPNSTP